MNRIFISYRRADSQWQAEALHSALKTHLADPHDEIFLDIDNIPLGADFAAYIDSRVRGCDVLLALIGPNWLNASERNGERRLDNPNDLVRLEVASALARDIPVVPLLLNGTEMPPSDSLPYALKQLTRKNGVEISSSREFDSFCKRLLADLKRIKKTMPPPNTDNSHPNNKSASVNLINMAIDPLSYYKTSRPMPLSTSTSKYRTSRYGTSKYGGGPLIQNWRPSCSIYYTPKYYDLSNKIYQHWIKKNLLGGIHCDQFELKGRSGEYIFPYEKLYNENHLAILLNERQIKNYPPGSIKTLKALMFIIVNDSEEGMYPNWNFNRVEVFNLATYKTIDRITAAMITKLVERNGLKVK